VEGFAELAQRRGLRLIYDAAHAFGARYHGRSLCAYGDISSLSFHATKLFHTAEGGAVVTDDDALAHRISYLRNFGHNGPEAFWGLGVNAKGNELQAAMGLCVLPHVPALIEGRRAACARYATRLDGLPLTRPLWRVGLDPNFAYYPVLFESETRLLRTRDALNAREIFPRRYFYPALSRLPYVDSAPMPIAESIAARVLCLPLHAELAEADIDAIADCVRQALA
jgi:dTDP-4-amino-4,6-dideoxygalactose transaminase